MPATATQEHYHTIQYMYVFNKKITKANVHENCMNSVQCTDLFAAVDDILGEAEPADAGTADDRVMPGRRMRHLHGAEL